jgi:hypothetical protein
MITIAPEPQCANYYLSRYRRPPQDDWFISFWPYFGGFQVGQQGNEIEVLIGGELAAVFAPCMTRFSVPHLDPWFCW